MKATYKMQKNNLCVLCEKQGTLVKNITVKHMVPRLAYSDLRV
jgi:hypothetical protein